MMDRLRTVALAFVLLASAGLGIATTVQGEAFEQQAMIEEAGSAYTIDWQDDQAGKVRIQLVPAEGAAAPLAQVSLFDEEGAFLASYTLDEAWPQVDRIVQAPGTFHLVVHQAEATGLEILTEEEMDVTVSEAELDVDRVRLLEGAHEDLAYQVSLDREDTLVNLAVLFEGEVTDLQVQALTQEGEVVFEGALPVLEAERTQAVPVQLDAAHLEATSLLVRIQASTFNGTLAIEMASIQEDVRRSFTLDHEPHGSEEENESEPNETEEAPDGNTTATHEPPLDGVIVTELEDAPMAFEVEAGLEQAYVIGEEGDGFFTLFGPDDEVVDLVVLDEESEGAIWWDEDEHLIAVPVSLTEAGEHVVVLRSYDGGFLFLPDVTEAPEHRELELATTDVELEPSEEESSLFVVSESTAEGNTTLDSGLVGFTFESHLLETRNEVTLYGPDGDQVAGASSEFGGFYHEFCPDGQGFAAAGPAGAYHVVAEREGVFTGGNATVTLITYVR